MQTLVLEPHHIVDVFVLVDDCIEEDAKPKGGRPKNLKDSELITIFIWNCVTRTRQQTLKDVFFWALQYHHPDFPGLKTYGAFVSHCQRIVPKLLWFLQELLVPAPLELVDSTKLPVCANHRAKAYKVARDLVAWSKNYQGFWFGFKLHVAVDPQGRLSGLALTSADVYDSHVLPSLINQTKVVVGDSHYGNRIIREFMAKQGIIIVAPAHYKQKKQLMAGWQEVLLRLRSKIETTFDYLKQHLHLVSSFPRSAKGYLVHYARILLGYQMMVL